ncbi:MAG: iron-only hydrogenase system regulator [Lachnospiraceae bacterium]|nr:iron-only hydrogenase system regulator [Lachnospiraceae bacterium]
MENREEKRLAWIGIIVSEQADAAQLNALLSQWAEDIIGRMGLPHQRDGLSLISIAMDAPGERISALSGRLGQLKGVTAKVLYAPQNAGSAYRSGR